MIRARAGLGRAICCSLGRLAQRHQQATRHFFRARRAAAAAAAASASRPAPGAARLVLGASASPAWPRPFSLRPATSPAASMSSSAAPDPRPGDAGAPVAVRDGVVLTDQEEALFATLLAAARAPGGGGEGAAGAGGGGGAAGATVLRAAGGWVRDKLLGRASVDIDIALDNMYGKDFAEKVNEYLASQGLPTHSAAVIQSNPDQSKHLETARIKVPVLPLLRQKDQQQQQARPGAGGTSGGGGGGGDAAAPAAPALWIDLVNLRSETYAEGSRIPTMEFGTPQQDAERRDFTINALFYNINEARVEDLTGRGLSDLRAGLVRTPLPARETFADDPLRALRAVRFGARLGFALDAGVVEAAASDEVRAALSTKVSRERIGIELDGMLCGPAPSEAVATLARLRLFPAVFAPPPDVAARLPEAEYAAAAARCCAVAEALERADAAARPAAAAAPAAGDGGGGDGGGDRSGAGAAAPGALSREERRLLLLAATLLPLRGAETTAGDGGGAGGGGKGGGRASAARPQPAAAAVVRGALKWRAKDAGGVAMLHEAAPELAAIHARLVRGGGSFLGAAGATTGADEGGGRPGGDGALSAAAAAAAAGAGGGGGSAAQVEGAEEDVKVALGRVIRRLKEQWRLAALLAPLLSLPEAQPLAVEASAGGSQPASDGPPPRSASASARADPSDAPSAEVAAAAQLSMSRDIEAAARAWSLADCWQWRPLLDGKAAMAAVGMARQGPALGRLLNAALEWQYARGPSGTAAECAAWLARAYDAEGNAKKGEE